jgi:crossover junction endodeoxyribonuclease RuvC
MIILGIDPGSRKTGYAVINVEGKKISYISSGILKYDHVDEFLERLGMIYRSCDDLVEKFNPDEIVIEALIYVKSVEALSKLAQARGAMIAAFSKKNIGKIYEYSPNTIKSSVTGHGHADKEAVDKAMTMMFGKMSFKTSDESDALAIAVCHALNRVMKFKMMGKSV